MPSTRERDGVHLQVALQQPAVDAARGSRRGCGTRTRARSSACVPTSRRTGVCSFFSPGSAKREDAVGGLLVRQLAGGRGSRGATWAASLTTTAPAAASGPARRRRGVSLGGALPGEAAAPARSAPASRRSAQVVVLERPGRRRGAQSRGVVARRPAGRWPVAHHRGQSADGGGDHRCAGGLRLDGDQPEATRCTTARRPAWRGVPVDQLGLRHRRHEPHHVVDAELLGQLGERLGVLEPGAGGAADDRDDQPRAQRGGLASSSTATARSITSGAFSGWIRPTNSSTVASAGSPSRARARPRVDGTEGGQVDARVHDLDPAGVGVVQVDAAAWPRRRCWP